METVRQHHLHSSSEERDIRAGPVVQFDPDSRERGRPNPPARVVQSGRLTSVPPSDVPELFPGVPGLDDLELFRQGLISQDLLNFPHGPVNYVDAEGAPVASLSQTGKLRWGAPRSVRPYERWHTGMSQLIFPLAIIDRPDGLQKMPEDVGTVVVLASTDASRADLKLVRLARQRAKETGVHLVVLPLGSAAEKRPEKLTQILETLQDMGAVANHTSPESTPHQLDAGIVVLFTGLSGSGKSTVARALTHHLIEEHGLEVSLLDGDVVRRHLTHGLTFSIADRNTNVRRIGWVAAEIARHGGIAVASLIAPFDSVRREVRQMVTERGGHFLLVHITTPVEECERRDRKGLYAKARAGIIPDFTGISSPYEPPSDAELRLNATDTEVTVLKDAVVGELNARGWLQSLPGFLAQGTTS